MRANFAYGFYSYELVTLTDDTHAHFFTPARRLG